MPRKSAAAIAEHQITVTVRGDQISRMGRDPAAFALDAIERLLAIEDGTMSPGEFARRTKALGIPRTRFAQLSGYSPAYVQRVADGRQKVTPGLQAALEVMERDKKLGRDIILERVRRRNGGDDLVMA